MFKLSKQNRDTLIAYFNQSNLPHQDVVTVCKMLSELEEIKEKTK